jgi:hypothetical protein
VSRVREVGFSERPGLQGSGRHVASGTPSWEHSPWATQPGPRLLSSDFRFRDQGPATRQVPPMLRWPRDGRSVALTRRGHRVARPRFLCPNGAAAPSLSLWGQQNAKGTSGDRVASAPGAESRCRGRSPGAGLYYQGRSLWIFLHPLAPRSLRPREPAPCPGSPVFRAQLGSVGVATTDEQDPSPPTGLQAEAA